MKAQFVLLTALLSVIGTVSAQGRLVVTATDKGVVVPTTIESGYTEFVLDNQASMTYANEIVRLKEGGDPELLRKGIVASSTGTADKATIGRLMTGFDVFMGGVVGTSAGSTRSVGMNLTPGTYVVYADNIPDIPDERGLALDVAHTAVVTVTETANPVPEPKADLEIKLVEYAFALPAGLTAGTQLVQFENIGKEDHLGFVFKLPDGVSAEEAKRGVERGGDESVDWASAQGVHKVGAGAVVYAEMTFEPGATYLYICPILNDAGVPHDTLGMMQFVTIAN